MNRIEAILEGTEGTEILHLGAVQHDAQKATDADWLHQYLTIHFHRVIGVDILAEEVERLNDYGYEMVQADVQEMDLSFEADSVVAGELIEHVENPGQMLDRIRAHLKPGGALILSTPNPWAIGHIIRLLLGKLSVNPEHVAWYGPITLEQLLERHGFEVEEVKPVGPKLGGVARLLQAVGIESLGRSTWYIKARLKDE